ncbi:MAG: GAF domain-containing protein [Chitinophagaceae bacterium]|nr:GAF domain-containing protein [Anaerolineae bacterium]
MNRFIQFLPFNSWSIRVKLVLSFLVAVLVPTLLAVLIIRNEVTAADLTNLSLYIQEQGTEQQRHITEDFNQVRQTLGSFVANPTYNDLILGVLTTANSQIPIPSELQSYIDNTLIGGGSFSRLVIVDRNGLVLGNNTITPPGNPIPPPLGADWSQSAGYREGVTALNLNSEDRVALFEDNGRVFPEIAYVFTYQGRDWGYVIGTINVQTIFLDELDRSQAFRPIESFMTTLSGQVIAPASSRQPERLSAMTSIIRRALGEETGVATYTTEGQSYLAYFAPIPGTAFVIVTDTSSNQTFTVTLAQVSSRITLLVGGIVIFSLLLGVGINQFITPSLRGLERSIRAMSNGDFDAPVSAAGRRDEIGSLARSFIAMREQARGLVEELQKRVDARVRDLQATQEVSRFASTQRDLQVLMDNVVTLIANQFPNIYHAQIFLVDDEGRNAILRASTGEAGRNLLARGHRLEVGGVSVIGQVTDEGRVVVARDTAASNVHKQNEFLPETRAELAIPLRFGDTIIGALDVQSRESDSFSEDQVRILQTMADQIAIAIENARLYQESIQRLEEITLNNQQATQAAWQEYMNAQRVTALTSSAGTETGMAHGELRRSAITHGAPVVGEVTERDTVPVAVPIMLRGQTLGAIAWELRADDFDYDKVLLGQELVNRLAISLDNARLFQESRRAITRERLVNEISTRLTAQTDVDSILQTAVREVGQALRAPQVTIQLQGKRENGSENLAPTNGTNGHLNGSE